VLLSVLIGQPLEDGQLSQCTPQVSLRVGHVVKGAVDVRDGLLHFLVSVVRIALRPADCASDCLPEHVPSPGKMGAPRVQ
tara:strand:- start:604 stop:843 length:240 start_codon:yes stop_codon:yes gene_type:complete